MKMLLRKLFEKLWPQIFFYLLEECFFQVLKNILIHEESMGNRQTYPTILKKRLQMGQLLKKKKWPKNL